MSDNSLLLSKWPEKWFWFSYQHRNTEVHASIFISWRKTIHHPSITYQKMVLFTHALPLLSPNKLFEYRLKNLIHVGSWHLTDNSARCYIGPHSCTFKILIYSGRYNYLINWLIRDKTNTNLIHISFFLARCKKKYPFNLILTIVNYTHRTPD